MKSQLTGKDPDAGKDWGQEEKGTTENEMVGFHHWLKMDVNLSKLWEIVKDREAWHAAVMGLQRVGHDWETEQLKNTSCLLETAAYLYFWMK